jgi:hypothetical protein
VEGDRTLEWWTLVVKTGQHSEENHSLNAFCAINSCFLSFSFSWLLLILLPHSSGIQFCLPLLEEMNFP